MLRRRGRRRLSDYHHEEDPLSGAINFVDCMFVLAMAFAVFFIMAWNMQSLVFAKMSLQEKRELMEAVKKSIEVKQGKELNQTPEVSKGSGQGYAELGTVYKDPR